MIVNEIIKDKVWTFDNFLTKVECENYIKQIDEKKNKICFTNTGRFENDKYQDQNLAYYFYNKLPIKKQYNLLRPNNLIMTGKYNFDQNFDLHTDTGLYFDKNKKEKSKYTLLIYLNDNYKGGETEFYDEDFEKIAEIVPKIGMALLFDIDLWHKGNKLINGTKYWIGCEIISNF